MEKLYHPIPPRLRGRTGYSAFAFYLQVAGLASQYEVFIITVCTSARLICPLTHDTQPSFDVE
ncbi:hypothetical protein C0J52_06934 [Blattella germanica]|nr:hypothetical protein C0J52_06934 [Blattella germanica]